MCGCGASSDYEPDRWVVALDPAVMRWWVIGPGVYDGRGFDSQDEAGAWAAMRETSPADLNGSGHTDTGDFFDFLDAFFRGATASEWDGVRGIGTGDFYTFINDFLGGDQ